ncbi:anti-sigma regulatory factor [Peribacillus sp. SCS-155]|uniref:anti-sigma regulatory factor n=1 Tax=Peribacillus sedimenti TaxID=3115297 RepID=UPI0039061A84
MKNDDLQADSALRNTNKKSLLSAKSSFTVEIRQEWDIVHARKIGRELSYSLKFTTVNRAKLVTAISELARNMYQHAGSGQIRMEPVHERTKYGIRVTAIDQGPGIKDKNKALKAGYSTSGGLGVGLPWVKKLMDEFSLESTVDTGTRITIVKWQII